MSGETVLCIRRAKRCMCSCENTTAHTNKRTHGTHTHICAANTQQKKEDWVKNPAPGVTMLSKKDRLNKVSHTHNET